VWLVAGEAVSGQDIGLAIYRVVRTVVDGSRYDCIVVGAGAIGSAAGWWLARRGKRVLVVDQYEAGHIRGSSHGASRIFRLGYAQPEYTEMALEARFLWRELEEASGEQLLEPVGAVDHGPAGEVEPIGQVYDRCRVPYEVLAPDAAARRWPGMRFDGDVLHQPDGACIRADMVLRALHKRIRDHGGDLRLGIGRAWADIHADDVHVRAPGLSASAPAAVIAAGPWAAETLGGLVPLPPLTVTREQVFYFPSARTHYSWPCFIHRGEPAQYGLNTPGQGVKVAEHHTGQVVTADARSFGVEPAGRDRVIGFVRDWLPGLKPEPTSFETCLYTSTPSEDFVIDRFKNLIVAAGFSGHGFKFTPLIGRLIADMAEDKCDPPALFRLSQAADPTRHAHL
jgi:sarcosine oxidase